ncbi:MAG: SIMPL domain-containing protein [Sphingomonas sp.]|uniref:SIMPL domain-containing protein n=1 Tax=Sphingomonas sp. TaxID=28214 RepID=UPI003F7FAEDA
MMLALATPADAQPVTVEIVAVGHAETPADRYEISGVIVAGADSDTAAAALLAKRKQAVLDQVAAAGANAVIRDGSEFELFSSDPAAAMSLARGNVDAKVEGKNQVSAIVTITAPNRAAIDKVKAAIASIPGVRNTGTPLSSLNDAAAARRVAKADAMVKAKTEADGYANRLGFGNAVLTAISEKTDFSAMFQANNGKVPALAMFQKSTDDTVTTEVTLTVTYRLDTKR